MQRLSKLTDQERRDALCNAIRHKCRNGISSRHLACIIEKLNLSRSYFIKATHDCGKFLNIVTEEFVATPDRKTISFVIPLYGQFRCGYFYKYGNMICAEPGSMFGKHAAAALKITISKAENYPPGTTHTIVIYEKNMISSR